MSKLFEALQTIQSTHVYKRRSVPVSVQEPGMSESENFWKERYYPRFTDFRIDEFLDYLLSLHQEKAGQTYGIVPVSSSSAISRIVLETFMHLSPNCDGSTLLADLSSNRQMLEQLESSNSFDQPFSSRDIGKVLPILHNLFHFLGNPVASSQPHLESKFQYSELIKLTDTYSFSLIFFPPVSKFNNDCIQLARQVDNMILLSPENCTQEIEKSGSFLHKAKVNTKGVYLFE